MDPLTIWLCCLATAYVVRHLAVDGWAEINGRESPRMARRREQHRQAQRIRDDLGRPTVGQALLARVVQRIADPPPPGAFRRFVSDLWEDSWVDMNDARRARRERKRRQREDRPAPVTVDLHECDGGCAPPRWIPGELDVCSECAGHRYEWPPDPPRPSSPRPSPPRPSPPRPDPVDLDPVDTDPPPHVDPDPTPPTAWEPVDPPRPDPAPEPVKKEPTMTTPVIINGEIGCPEEALGFCDGALAVVRAANDALDTISRNLEGEGVDHGPLLSAITAASDDLDAVAMNLRSAAGEYETHVAVQADLLADPELRNTLVGYLSARRAHAAT